ncbi:MAG: hypothetical protein HeimC3_03980 [Candidatus Heimdallarchaeota archaeon LC_3]|nr:MAG: hypothetical protein HeimC3_03980 [Candidatus Heimdallarchaeota archaeon LC_3]
MSDEQNSENNPNEEQNIQPFNIEKIFGFWMKDLALMNSFLKGRLGDDFANKFFEYLINHHRKEHVRRNPKLEFEEFVELYSSMMSNVNQAHYELENESNISTTFFVFDCLPYKVMNSNRPSIMPSDFPCKIWCKKFVKIMANSYGFTGSMTKKPEGCYCALNNTKPRD